MGVFLCAFALIGVPVLFGWAVNCDSVMEAVFQWLLP